MLNTSPSGWMSEKARQVVGTDGYRHRSHPTIEDPFAEDESAYHFIVGTVYQAFLRGLNYHRWHAPVAGTTVRACGHGGPAGLVGRSSVSAPRR